MRFSLAIYAAKPRRVDDRLFIEAAHACAEQVIKQDLQKGKLYPSQADILQTEVAIATALARYLFRENLAGVEEPEDVSRWLQEQLHQPRYQPVGHANRCRDKQ